MASFRLGLLLLLLLATYPGCILEASALVPQLVPWRKASLQHPQHAPKALGGDSEGRLPSRAGF